MANQYAIQDPNRFPALLGHSGTAGTAETRRIVSGAGGEMITGLPEMAIAQGLIAGMSHINKFGRNSAIGTPGFNDIWDETANNWVPPTTGRLHNISSTSTADTSAGTGARTVQVIGLDGGFNEQEEAVTLAGTALVATAGTYAIVYRMFILTAGSGASNVGTILATAQTDATVTAQISPTNNQTLMAIYQIPLAKSGYLQNYYASINKTSKTANADIRVLTKAPGEVWQVKHHMGMVATGVTQLQHDFQPPVKFEAKTILKLAGQTDIISSDISAGFDVILVDD